MVLQNATIIYVHSVFAFFLSYLTKEEYVLSPLNKKFKMKNGFAVTWCVSE
jgi:hypothetical protein